MRVVQAFSRAAGTYGQYNIIQREAARYLISEYLPGRPGRILDLGCGNGEVCRQLLEHGVAFDALTGADLSSTMLALHPRGENIVTACVDFNDLDTLRKLGKERFHTVLSSSALQWASDLDGTLSQLSRIGEQAAFSIFTSGTFRSLHDYLGVDSPIRGSETVSELLTTYYEPKRLELKKYRLDFASRAELFAYIKKSGVSGGRPLLGIGQIRRLLREYPYRSLEFEVLFFSGRPRSSFSRA
jgi:malonyl-CoA O-methyltransferase